MSRAPEQRIISKCCTAAACLCVSLRETTQRRAGKRQSGSSQRTKLRPSKSTPSRQWVTRSTRSWCATRVCSAMDWATCTKHGARCGWTCLCGVTSDDRICSPKRGKSRKSMANVHVVWLGSVLCSCVLSDCSSVFLCLCCKTCVAEPLVHAPLRSRARCELHQRGPRASAAVFLFVAAAGPPGDRQAERDAVRPVRSNGRPALRLHRPGMVLLGVCPCLCFVSCSILCLIAECMCCVVCCAGAQSVGVFSVHARGLAR